MRTQRLGFVGLGEDTVSACLSMLKIIDGRSPVQWRQSSPEQADVLMVSSEHHDHACGDSLTHKPCILVYPNSQQKPASTFSLPHPFRVMQLLDVLEDVVHTLDASDPSDADTSHTETATVPTADFCASLYQAINGQAQPQSELYGSDSPEGRLLVRPGSHRFYARPPLLHALSAGHVSFAPLTACNETVSEGMVPRPLFELAWLTGGKHSHSLLPWLDENSTFRLSRWPSAAALNKSRQLLSLCALMNRRALSLRELKSLAQCEDNLLYHFINACEISGLLVSQRHTAPAPQLAHAGEDNRRFGSMIRGLRTRLGLS